MNEYKKQKAYTNPIWTGVFSLGILALLFGIYQLVQSNLSSFDSPEFDSIDASQSSNDAEGTLIIVAGTENQDPIFSPYLFLETNPNLEIIMLESGLQYQDLVVGDGSIATPGQTVLVHYIGWLIDETKFDSSLDRNQPFEFVLGQGRVISGWEQGVLGMQVGGTRLLFVPAHLGYGERGSDPVIPPNAILVFRIELLEI